MKRLIYIFALISTTLISCSTSKSLRVSSNTMILNYQNELNITLSEKTKKEIPNCEIWMKDRDEFVKMIEEYKMKNEVAGKRANRTSIGFTVSGTIIGVGGGIYGLFSNSEPKGAAVTSIVAGALTGLVGSLNIQKKAERANSCDDFLNIILLDYKAYWGPARCPRNEAEFQTYLESKNDIINKLKEMKCFGLSNNQSN